MERHGNRVIQRLVGGNSEKRERERLCKVWMSNVLSFSTLEPAFSHLNHRDEWASTLPARMVTFSHLSLDPLFLPVGRDSSGTQEENCNLSTTGLLIQSVLGQLILMFSELRISSAPVYHAVVGLSSSQPPASWDSVQPSSMQV